MKYALPTALLLTIAISSQAYAVPASARDSFKRIQGCVAKEKLPDCRNDITASSVPLYDRFASYGLARCLPKDSKFISENRVGNHLIIRASTKASGSPRIMRLAFVNEEEQWKLDVPKSLRDAMGENWEKQINATEQIYLLLRQQFGTGLNCDAINALVQPK